MLITLRKRMTREQGQKGFTLVELIVVMAILAVLAALAVPKFSNILGLSKIKAHNANVELIEKAGELWYVQTAQSGAIGAAVPGAAAFQPGGAGGGNDLVPDYLKQVPNNPTGGAAYTISFDANGVATVLPVKQ